MGPSKCFRPEHAIPERSHEKGLSRKFRMLTFCFPAFAFRLSSGIHPIAVFNSGTCLQKLAIAALLSALAFASDVLPLLSLLESELEMSFGP